MNTYWIRVTGQSKASWEKHYTTSTWTAYLGTDHDEAKKVAKQVAQGVRTVRVLKDGEAICVWTQPTGWRLITEEACECDGQYVCGKHARQYQATFGRAVND